MRHPLDQLAHRCHLQSKEKGFWPEDLLRNKGEMIALIHSELSECLEAVRKPAMDEHCPEHTSEAIEMADAIIRILDYCAGHGIDLGPAFEAKMEFNRSRPYKHGKAF
jgi:NTP pyrophosphatase (non-canonical NTP hydrolase)